MQTAHHDEAWATCARASSPVSGPLLALLRQRSGYPYDFIGQIELLLGVAPDTTTVYRILERFEKLGLAQSHQADSDKTGQRVRLYEATELTPTSAEQWLRSPIPHAPMRQPVAVRIAVSQPQDTPYLLSALDQYEQRCFQLLAAARTSHHVATWQDMEIKLTHEGINLLIKAELKWINLARGYIVGFQGGAYSQFNAIDVPMDPLTYATMMKGSSDLKGPLLALLSNKPGHPNRFAALLSHTLGPSWGTDHTNICRILRRFELAGLASAHPSESNGKRVKVYEATDLTPKATARWMISPLPGIPIREPMVVRVAVSQQEDAPLILDALDKHQKSRFLLSAKHQKMYATTTWKSMEKELTRKGLSFRINAELAWIDLARRYIASFRGARSVSAVV